MSDHDYVPYRQDQVSDYSNSSRPQIVTRSVICINCADVKDVPAPDGEG